jgi:hypothetical protein
MQHRWLVIVGVSSLLFACSKQGQGERCELLNGNADCESGLVCASARELRAKDEVDRCCPPVGVAFSSPRCDRSGAPALGSGGTGGQSTGGAPGGAPALGGTAGVAATAGAGGTAGAGVIAGAPPSFAGSSGHSGAGGNG